MSSMIKNRRILIAGGAGSIGTELVRQLAPKNKIFILDISENAYGLSEELKQKGYWVEPRVGDIRNKDTVADIFEDFKPQIVINSAAYKEVPPMEIYPREAKDVNIDGNLNLLEEARKWECLEKFIFISTDKVISSCSVMGASKRFSEIATINKKGVVVRFGNVMGSRGSLIPIWQRQHDTGQPLTVTHENMSRYMMTIPQACELVIKAIEESSGGEIFIMKMGQRYNILELAKEIVKSTGQQIRMIGVRPGETFTENLMFEEEKCRAKEELNFYIIK